MHPRILAAAALACAGMASASFADWSPLGKYVSDLPHTQAGHSFLADGEGGAFVAWFDRREPRRRVYLSHLRRTGELAQGWEANGNQVPLGGLQAIDPVLVGDGRSGVFVIAERMVAQPPTSAEYAVIRVMGNGRLAPGWDEEGVRLGLPDGALGSQVLGLSDGRGGMLVFVGPNGNVGLGAAAVYAQRVDASGRMLWGEEGRRLLGPGGVAFAMAAVSDDRGGAFFAWLEGGTAPERARLVHLGPDGLPSSSWPAEGLAVSAGPTGARRVRMVSDGRGGVIVAWSEHREAGDPRARGIYAQRFDASGSRVWSGTPDGVLLSTPPSSFVGLAASTDGQGGLIAGWGALPRDRVPPDLYVQRVGSDGSILWGPNGTLLVAASEIQEDLTIAPDYRGGASFAWSDFRGGYPNYAIYATRFGADGRPLPGWPEGGVPHSEIPTPQDPILVQDHGGEPLIAWRSIAMPLIGVTLGYVFVAPVALPEGEPVVERQRFRAERLAQPMRASISGAGDIQVDFQMASDGAAEIEVFDLAGRKVASRNLGWRASGDQRLALAIDRAHPSGVYLVRVRQPLGSQVTRVALLR